LADGEKCKIGEVVEKPVEAKVISVVDDRVVLEFLATKIQGAGVGGGKVWTDGLKIIVNREELTYEAKDKIIVDESGDAATLVKAKAVGVRGIVLVGDRIISGLPIVRLSPQQMEIFKKWGKESNRIWLNGTSGKIFIT
jgi:hypothetical protein